MNKEARAAKKANLEIVRQAPAATRQALCAWLKAELMDAWLEMETCNDNAALWRAQGRAQEARNILNAMQWEPKK